VRSVGALWSRPLGVVLVFHTSAVAGSWPDLVQRLDAAAALPRWARTEPALHDLSGVGALADVAAPGADPARADEVLGALVRWAAVDGGDDRGAVLVVLHLLSEGAAALAAKVSHRSVDPLAMVVGELTCQVRTFPWQRRRRAFAAGLLLDTKHALWRGELRPPGDGRSPREAMLIDPAGWPEVTGHRRSDGEPAGDGDVDLIDLLVWAASGGVAEPEDLRLLLELERQRGYGSAARHRVAAAFGISEKTVRRRRDRALGALRAVTGDYLAAVA